MTSPRPVTPANFAVLAASRITHGDAAEAVRLCADGLATYPDYLGGYVVLARAYDVLGRHDDAYIIRTEAHRRFPWLPWVGPLGETSVEPQPTTHVETDQSDVETAETAVETATEIAIETLTASTAEAESEPSADTDVVPLSVVHADTMAESPTLVVMEHEAVPTADEDIDVPIDAPINAPIDAPIDEAASTDEHAYSLRLITAAMPTDDTRIIRSAAVRLIPGLEFTSLRFEGVKQRGRRSIQQLLDPPAFRTFPVPVRAPRRAAVVPAVESAPAKRPLSLEELAARLERARMPRTNDPASAPVSSQSAIVREAVPAPVPPQTSTAGVVVASETMARIYASQGSYDMAISVYRTLQQQQPERHDYFQQLIDAVAATRGA